MASELYNVAQINERAKMEIAKRLYELKHLKKFNTLIKDEQKAEFMDCVLYQISVCEQLGSPISVEKIMEWINVEDIGKVRTESRSIKFAS